MRKIAKITVAIIAIALVLWFAILYFGPDRCPLCDFIKSHAPCLVNVATGEVEEMALYTPHYQLVGEIAEEQNDSTFSFVTIAGARGTRVSSPWIMELDVPVAKEPLFKYHFCRDCRKLLADQAGYVIADLYVHGQPVVIPITDGMEQELRCYKITAVMNVEDNVIELKVVGTFK
ncbi:MAG: hypothetical protein II211_04830 [Peptococcaceae bacterium]|nr:hypothetical protein [Peptococcaceae bacterium]